MQNQMTTLPRGPVHKFKDCGMKSVSEDFSKNHTHKMRGVKSFSWPTVGSPLLQQSSAKLHPY